MTYRPLTEYEIQIFENNNCWAEDWARVEVVEEGFQPKFFHRVMFYGDIRLGRFEKNVEVTKDFVKHSGINDATLRNVSVGNNCLIEKVGNYINNYTIGDDCIITNISVMETTEGATYGEGNIIAVLNEVGDGNIILFHDLNSQFAAFMVKHFKDKDLKNAIRRLISEELTRTNPDRGTIGNNVKIVNTKEITNTVIQDDCEISGASRLSDCTILSSEHASVYIGTGVICENSIISDGSSIINSVKMQDCFVGEACQISNGFTASQSVFFANSFMANGEACAAFCGHILMPATIGTFSVCFGKLMHHPNTQALPFSYLIASGDTMFLVPGRNITTVGLYRDIRKWPKRDMRPQESQKSIVNFDWLSPFSVGEIIRGKKILENLLQASGENVSSYIYHEYVINASSLHKGIKFYDIALKIYMGAVLKRAHKWGFFGKPETQVGLGKWNDLSGLLLPESEEQRLIEDIKNGEIETIQDVIDRFTVINDNYRKYQWAWTYRLILDYYGIKEITEEDDARIKRDYIEARRAWIAEIRKDAEKEYAMGDVEEGVFTAFVNNLDHEIDFEE